MTGAAAYTEAQVEAALSTALTNDGNGFGLVNLDATDPAHPKLILYTRKSFSAFTTPLDGSLGLPGGLGLRSSGMCQTVMDYTFNFVVGIDSGGFYLDTANNPSQFSAGFRMTVPRLETAATLSQLRFRLADESATDGDAVPPTLFSGSFAVDLLDPSGADNKLR